MPRKRKPAEKKIAVKPPDLTPLILGQWKKEVTDTYLRRLCESFELLTDEEIWWRPNDASNSMGNIVLHLCGNVRQWIISGLGGSEDTRQRDLEFSEKGPIPRDILLAKLRGTVNEASRVIANLSAKDLSKTYEIQGYRAAGVDVLVRIPAHFAYHAGQVVYFAKMRRAKDLGLTKLPSLSAKSK
jgi:hypothetical protein